jgi:hypothetical protein
MIFFVESRVCIKFIIKFPQIVFYGLLLDGLEETNRKYDFASSGGEGFEETTETGMEISLFYSCFFLFIGNPSNARKRGRGTKRPNLN